MAVAINSLSRIIGSRIIRESDRNESSPYEDTSSTSVKIDARISAYPLGEHHPLAHLFGSFNDEPLWEEFEAEIRANPNVIDYEIE